MHLPVGFLALLRCHYDIYVEGERAELTLEQ
jgi:hypothetical protein